MGFGGVTGSIREQSKAVVASAITQFHCQGQSIRAESSSQEKKTICLLLCARGRRFNPRRDQLNVDNIVNIFQVNSTRIIQPF